MHETYFSNSFFYIVGSERLKSFGTDLNFKFEQFKIYLFIY